MPSDQEQILRSVFLPSILDEPLRSSVDILLLRRELFESELKLLLPRVRMLSGLASGIEQSSDSHEEVVYWRERKKLLQKVLRMSGMMC